MISKDKIDELKKKYNVDDEVTIKQFTLIFITIQHRKWSVNYSYNQEYGISNLKITHPFECENLNNILLFLKEVSEGKE